MNWIRIVFRVKVYSIVFSWQFVFGLALIGFNQGIQAASPASVAVFVVDRSPEFDAMGGECVRYDLDQKSGPNKILMAFAKAAPRSTIVFAAFEASTDRLLDGLKPLVIDQSQDSVVAIFPASDSKSIWKFDHSAKKCELFLVVGLEGDTRIKEIRDSIARWDAVSDPQAKSLHATTLRNTLTSLMRSQNAPAEGRKLPNSVAAARRGLTNLKEHWKEDSSPLSYGPNKPGVTLIRIEP
jgi:hypothetical protein